jgi:hypothetical protein
LPVFIAAPIPAIAPQPSTPTTAGSASGIDPGSFAFVHNGFVCEGTGTKAAVNGVPSGKVMGCEALWPRRPRLQAQHWPQTVRQLRITIADLHVGDGIPNGFDDSSGLVAEEEGKFVVDLAFSMGHVSGTNAAGLDSHHDIARAGMGQSYLDEFNGSIGLARSDTTNGLRHEATFLTESPVAERS